jgi:cytochrome c oxidase cbb3-type subunit 3
MLLPFIKKIFRLATTLMALALVLSSCKREERNFQTPPLNISDAQSNPSFKNPLEQNAYALSEGKRLFSQYNCNGCHAQGGGGMGPPLMDEKWIYGARPEQIFDTITEGRPNGMPSFRERVPDTQIWQLAAYVRSLGGHVRKDAAPSRDDHMQGKPPESRTGERPIKNHVSR